MTNPKLTSKVRLYTGTGAPGGRSRLLAWAELTISDAFVIKDIRVLSTPAKAGDGEVTFVAFPSRKGKEAEQWFDVAHPITPAAHKEASELILSEYRKVAQTAAPF
jgi:DNA-binding cell septation regulator SpoVG